MQRMIWVVCGFIASSLKMFTQWTMMLWFYWSKFWWRIFGMLWLWCVPICKVIWAVVKLCDHTCPRETCGHLCFVLVVIPLTTPSYITDLWSVGLTSTDQCSIYHNTLDSGYCVSVTCNYNASGITYRCWR